MPLVSRAVFVCAALLLFLGAVTGLSYMVAPPNAANSGPFQLVKAEAAGTAETAEMYNREGLSMFSEGKYDQAIPHYDQAIQVDPHNVKAYNNRGVTYAKEGKYHRAIADYTEALSIDPQFAEAYHNRALAYFHTKNYSRSCSDLRAYEKLGGKPSPAFVKDLESAAGPGRC
jgi:tetratricopeptide (TPR) repeat protein